MKIGTQREIGGSVKISDTVKIFGIKISYRSGVRSME